VLENDEDESSCVLRVSRVPDDSDSLVRVVNALPGVNGDPVKGKFNQIVYN
jgi:hypothetical protein